MPGVRALRLSGILFVISAAPAIVTAQTLAATQHGASTAPARMLYRALLETRLGPETLPSRFHSGRAHGVTPDRKALLHGIVGKVEVDIDVNAAEIIYGVFGTSAGALASFREEKLPSGKKNLQIRGLPRPALLFKGLKRIRARSGAWASAHYVAITFVSGNVIGEASVIVSPNAAGPPGQLKPLALLAFDRLQAVRERLGRVVARE